MRPAQKESFRRDIDHTKYKPNLYNDHFQNFKRYNIPKAQLIIADIPYNVGKDAYGSNPSWYIGGDNANGESKMDFKRSAMEFFVGSPAVWLKLLSWGMDLFGLIEAGWAKEVTQ